MKITNKYSKSAILMQNFLKIYRNKKVLITGATGGIGNSLVKKFDSLGSIIVASGTNEDKLLKFPPPEF